jgi:predicted O-linked N-acetylglucosamine transferase (SPINDLY family)
LPDRELAGIVRRDHVDILVDLTGHTNGNRLLVFARKPAPIQVTWNGYANTTGMEAMDYRITDAYADPPGMTEHLHTERLVRLPEIYMAYQPPDKSPPVGPPPGLANGYVTFGSFNAMHKVGPSVIALWARILKALPTARLMMLTVSEGTVRARLAQAFADHGIDPERLELIARLPFDQFLEAHQRADIALDPFPFNGTTTTCQTLWMGVPLITLAGRSHVSRVGVSMLSNLGLQRLVACDEAQYVSLAVTLAQDREDLTELRAGLRQRMLSSPNTDGARLTRFLEAEYAKMWKDYCSRTDA